MCYSLLPFLVVLILYVDLTHQIKQSYSGQNLEKQVSMSRKNYVIVKRSL